MLDRTHRIVSYAGAGVLAAVLGCGSSDTIASKAVVPVQGAIFVGNKPAVGAIVTFWPLDDANPKALPSQGRVGKDGTFSLTTYATADGAPAGNYVVAVYWPDPSKKPRNEEEEGDLAPDLLKKRFAVKGASVLRAKVGNKATVFARVDLDSAAATKSREYQLPEK